MRACHRIASDTARYAVAIGPGRYSSARKNYRIWKHLPSRASAPTHCVLRSSATSTSQRLSIECGTQRANHRNAIAPGAPG